MKAAIEITDDDIRKALCAYIHEHLGLDPKPEEVVFQVRSKQNFRVKEWENGELRVQLLLTRKTK